MMPAIWLFILVLVLPLPGMAWENTGTEMVSQPRQGGISPLVLTAGRFDWSVRQSLFSPLSSSQPPPILPDSRGNLHIAAVNSQEVFTYTIINPQGQVLMAAVLQLEGLDRGSIYTHIPTQNGGTVVWAWQDEQNWNISAAFLDWDGNVIQALTLDYELSPQHFMNPISKILELKALLGQDGSMHLLLLAGDARLAGPFYLRFSPELEQNLSHIIAVTDRPHRPQTLGNMVQDHEGNIYALVASFSMGGIHKFTPSGEMHTWYDAVPILYDILGDPNTLYSSRYIAPAMDIDQYGVIHVVANHLTRPPFFGPAIVDVAYFRIKDREVLSSQVITDSHGASHYPGLTIHDNRVYITWEQPMGNAHELFYSIFDVSGSRLTPPHRLTWEKAPSRLGVIHSHADELTALWWSSRKGGTVLNHKSTHSPPPPSPWQKLGFDTQNPDNSIAAQLLFYSPMILVSALLRLGSNLDSLLWLIFGLFLLHKTGLLDQLMEHPLVMLVVSLLAIYLQLPAPETPGSLGGPVWLLFTALSATMMLTVFLVLGRVKVNNSFSLILSCLLWLFLIMIIQVLPVVPQQFAL